MADLLFTIEDFLAHCAVLEDFTNTRDKSFEAGAEKFLTEFYRDAFESGFSTYSLCELGGLARAFWMFPNRRLIGQSLLDISDMQKIAPECGQRDDSVIQIAVPSPDSTLMN